MFSWGGGDPLAIRLASSERRPWCTNDAPGERPKASCRRARIQPAGMWGGAPLSAAPLQEQLRLADGVVRDLHRLHAQLVNQQAVVRDALAVTHAVRTAIQERALVAPAVEIGGAAGGRSSCSHASHSTTRYERPPQPSTDHSALGANGYAIPAAAFTSVPQAPLDSCSRPQYPTPTAPNGFESYTISVSSQRPDQWHGSAPPVVNGLRTAQLRPQPLALTRAPTPSPGTASCVEHTHAAIERIQPFTYQVSCGTLSSLTALRAWAAHAPRALPLVCSCCPLPPPFQFPCHAHALALIELLCALADSHCRGE
jgi:hypothetical protein